MLKQILIFLLTIYSFSCFSQGIEKYKDSIATEIKSINSDSVKATRFYKESSVALRRFSNLKLCRAFLDSAMFYSKKTNFKDSEAKCHFMYGLLERVSGNYELALNHLDKNIRYFDKDSTNKAYALFQVGTIYRNLGDYQKSLQTFIEILNIFEHKKDSLAMASTYNSIANIYGDMDSYNEAILNYKKANSIFIEKDNKRSQANTLNNISEIYLRKKDTLSSRKFANQSLKISQDIQEDYATGRAYYMLGRTYLSSDKSKALEFYLKSKTILEKINFKKMLVTLYNDLGDFYNDNNNTTQAILYYNKALKILEDTNDLMLSKNTFLGLSTTYLKTNNFKKAYQFQSLYIKAKDSLFNEENIKSINLLQKQFETEKKDKEIVEQKLKLQQQENELLNKKIENKFLWALVSIFLLGAIGTWFIFQQRQKRKNQEILTLKKEQQIKSLESLIKGEEKERSRIAKDLHDGVNGDLSAIKHRLSKYQNQTGIDLSEAINMVDNSCDEVRAISHNLLPPALERYSLKESLSDYCMNLNEVRKEQISFQYIGEEFTFSKTAEITLFRIVQELVSNSLKHSIANEIMVQLTSFDDTIQLTVEDDGKGFENSNVKTLGLGLANVKSRVEYLNGELDTQSDKDGTHFNITFNKQNLNEG